MANPSTQIIASRRVLATLSMPARIALLTLIWTVICSLAAIPSFTIACSMGYSEAGMIVGIALFVAAYVAVGCTDKFDQRFSNNAAFRRTLYIGYTLRALVGFIPPMRTYLDLYPGILSVQIASAAGAVRQSFLETLITTLVQGCVLNFILALFMLILYAILKPFVRRPEEPRGFAVIPVTPRVEIPTTILKPTEMN